jgi:BolA family transcriptional regulator, general stress-responsive regulator
MREQLSQQLKPLELELTDDSHLHAGHAGARDGRGHYTVRIVAPRFTGLRPLQRHQLVYKALADMMLTDIHALVIIALAPDELR